ncbi:MAG TPA: hypothetical protein VHZ06_00810 [Marmoricola sp.]|jgi:hypothetical protein|nr:hypothetical protein [Marmoricola sp.]
METPRIRTTIEKIGAWSGLALLALFFVFFWLIADLVPPLDPGASAASISATYRDHHDRLTVGLALMVLFAPIVCGFIAALARQVRRVEGYWGVMSLTQILAGVIIPIGFIFPPVIALAAAYRPNADPDVTRALDDVFWLMFVGIVGTLVLQALILVVATFIDSSETPVFPRWFGYLNGWYAVLAVPGCAIFLFHSGPLAWNGIFAFWIPLVAFSGWISATTYVLLKAIGTEAS